MLKAALLVFVLPFACFAQAVETQMFRAVLLPASEVPAVSSTAKGTADVFASLVRDSSGQIVSGTVDILARVTFTAGATATGLGVWSGNAGQNGSLVFNSTLTGSNSYAIQTNDSIHQAIQVTTDNAAGIAALRAMVQNPAGYYVNLLTTANASGVIRGQLLRAQAAVLIARMTSSDVSPAPASAGFGVAQVVAIGTKDAAGNWNSAEVYLSATYSTQDQTAFTGFQVHAGTAGVTTTASLAPAFPGGVTPTPTGAGSIGPFYMELSTTTAAQTGSFSSLFSNPASQYVDLRTTGNPNGLMRGQLQAAGRVTLQVPLSFANELHPTSNAAAAPAALSIYTILNPDGTIAAGSMQADVDYRFTSAQQFLGLYLHHAPAGQDGPVAVQVGPDFHSDTASGNSFTWSAPIVDTATLESVLQHPDEWYLNLPTLDDPTGAARAQLQAASVGAPAVNAVISADLDKAATSLAPNGLVSIFGSSFSKVAFDLNGWSGTQLPFYLNGLGVTIGGRPAPLLYVSPSQINAQVPADVPPGSQLLVVGNAGGPIASYTVNITEAAPAIFFSPVAAILKNVDFSLVSTANPAKAGDVVLVYCTGMGQTTPALFTGMAPAPGVLARTSAAAATIGGKAATVVYSIASPGFAGLYQVAVSVPAGVTGSVPLVLQQGSATSNTVTLIVK